MVFINMKKKNDGLLSFTLFDLIILIFSCISVLCDICTDLILVVFYFNQGYLTWAIGTLVFIFVPSIIVNFFSFRWHLNDNSANKYILIFHILLLGLFQRHIWIIKAGINAYKSKNNANILNVYLEQSDLCMLHLFESFLESSPQLVLQVYLIANLNEWKNWTAISAIASLFSLAWALAMYTKTQRQARQIKNSSTWRGLLLQGIWRTGTLAARITAIVLGAYYFGGYIFLLLTLHWVAMTIWIFCQKTDFCESFWEEKIYNMVVGVIYCFCFFNLQEGRSRWRLFAFYLIIVTENVVCFILFLAFGNNSSYKLSMFGIIGIIGGTLVGTTSMLLYYKFNHPSGHINCLYKQQSPQQEKNFFKLPTTLWSLKQMHTQIRNTISFNKQTNSFDSVSPTSDSIIITEENEKSIDSQFKIFNDFDTKKKIDNHHNEEEKNWEFSPTKNQEKLFLNKRKPICSESDLAKLSEFAVSPRTYSESTINYNIHTQDRLLSPLYYENLSAIQRAEEIDSYQSDNDSSFLKKSQVSGMGLNCDISSTILNDNSEKIDSCNSIMSTESKICSSDSKLDDIFKKCSIDTLTITYPLSSIKSSNDDYENINDNLQTTPETKFKNNRVSALVATIDEIRYHTPLAKSYAVTNCNNLNNSTIYVETPTRIDSDEHRKQIILVSLKPASEFIFSVKNKTPDYRYTIKCSEPQVTHQMDLFLERMVHRFHDQVFNKMTPEKRARNLCVMKALARDSMRLHRNKENEDPLNNNTTFNLKHSTPIKYRKITDLDYPERILPVDISSTDTENFITKKDLDATEPKLVFAKIYELTPNGETNVIETSTSQNDNSKSEYEIIVSKKKQNGELNSSRKQDANWKSLNVLDDVAEYEFFKSLEQSKLCLSTSNLLEEIEADLPSHYSLAKPLNHTFHSLESYRTVTRLARTDKNLTSVDCVKSDDETDENVLFLKKLDFLEMEATVQKAKARQAEKALTLSKNKKSMDVEYFESEKTLLLSGLRLNAAVQEMEKLKRSGAANGCLKDNYGQVTIREIVFYVDDVTLNKVSESFICTATEKENVQFSTTLIKQDGKLYFDQPMKFQNLNRDFVISIQLFKRRGKEGKEPKKVLLMKKLKELAGNTLQKSITTSSCGEKHDFECVASTRLKLEHVSNRKHDKCVLKFSEPPQHPVLRDALVLYLKTDFSVDSKTFGFLNVFNNCCWQRWWFSQNGYFLNSWMYPEDEENNKPPVYSLHLPSCTEKVKIADLEVCIRPHSFVVVSGPNKEEILFSAESNKDMIKWMNHLNLVIECVRLWKPNA